jgi:hypothetical protein
MGAFISMFVAFAQTMARLHSGFPLRQTYSEHFLCDGAGDHHVGCSWTG